MTAKDGGAGLDSSEASSEDSTMHPSIRQKIADNYTQQPHTVIGTITAIVGATATVLALIASVIFGVNGWQKSAPEINSHPATSSPKNPIAGVTSEESQELLSIGTCLGAEGQVVSCDTLHEAEIIGPSDNCNLDAVIHYLGGDPDLDVVSTSLKVTESDDSCILQVENKQVSASFKDALFLSSGVTLRECFDKRSNQFVSCGENHTGEVVARVPADSAEPLDCEAKADQYMGQKFASRHDELTFDKIPTSTAQRCVVSVRTDNRWLDTSLRGLGTKALETRPMD